MKKPIVLFSIITLCALVCSILCFVLRPETVSDTHIIAVMRSPKNIFWADVWQGLQQEAQQHNLSISEYPYEDIALASGYLEISGHAQADAVIIGITDNKMIDEYGYHLLQLRKNGTKVVAVDTDPGEAYRDCFIGLDNYEVGRQVANEVAGRFSENGRILILTGNESSPSNKLRFEGCYDALQELDLLAYTDTLVFYADDIFTIPPFQAYLHNAGSPLLIVSIGPTRTLLAADIISKSPNVDHIQLIGFGESSEALAYVNNGGIDVLFMQDNRNLGGQAIEKTLSLLSGEEPIDQNSGLLIATPEHPEGRPVDMN